MTNQSPNPNFFSTLQVNSLHTDGQIDSFNALIPDFSFSPQMKQFSKEEELEFGFVPKIIVDQLNDQTNWRSRVQGIQELENCVTKLQNYDTVLPYMALLIRFLSKLLDDTNFKVTISTLYIIQTILKVPNVQKQANISQLIPTCIKRLGDNKIAIRQAAFKVFVELVKIAKPNLIFPQILESLKSSNWHVREECLNVLIAAMLGSEVSFDLQSIVQEVASLLDDTKSKIRHVATEVLATAVKVYGFTSIMEFLMPIVDDLALKILEERFKSAAIPILRQDGLIEFPKSVPSTAPVISSPYITTSSFGGTNYSAYTEFSPQKPIWSSPSKPPQPQFNSRTNSTNDLRPPAAKQGYANQMRRRNRDKRQFSDNISTQASEDTGTRSASCAPLGTSPAKVTRQDQGTYLSVEELTPVQNPDGALMKAAKDLETQDWEVQMEGCNIVRRLLQHHSHVFINVSGLHNVIVGLLKLSESLRSSVSKNALITLGEMFQQLGRIVDGELEAITPVLLRKSTDTNVFISEQSIKAIENMCEHCGESRVASALLSGMQNARIATIKQSVAKGFEVVFNKQRSGVTKMREIDRILKNLATFIQDASATVRNASKLAFQTFFSIFPNKQELDRILMRHLNDQEIKAIKNALNRSNTPVTRAGRSREPVSQPNTSFIQRKTRHVRVIAQNVDSPALEQIPRIQQDVQSGEWKKRYDALAELVEIIKNNIVQLQRSSKMLVALDLLTKSLTDTNLKVALYAIQQFSDLIPILDRSMNPHMNLLVQGLASAVASTNFNIRQAAKDCCSMLIAYSEPVVILPSVAQAVSNGNSRTIPFFISILADIVDDAYQVKSSLVKKYVNQIIYKYIDEGRGDIQREVQKLLEKVYQLMGSEIVQNAPTSKVQVLVNALDRM